MVRLRLVPSFPCRIAPVKQVPITAPPHGILPPCDQRGPGVYDSRTDLSPGDYVIEIVGGGGTGQFVGADFSLINAPGGGGAYVKTISLTNAPDASPPSYFIITVGAADQSSSVAYTQGSVVRVVTAGAGTMASTTPPPTHVGMGGVVTGDTSLICPHNGQRNGLPGGKSAGFGGDSGFSQSTGGAPRHPGRVPGGGGGAGLPGDNLTGGAGQVFINCSTC